MATSPKNGRRHQANRSPCTDIRLSLLVDPLGVLGEPCLDPCGVVDDGVAHPVGVALQRGVEPGLQAVADAVADFLRVNQAAVGDRRQRAAADDAQATHEGERQAVLLALAEHPAQGVELFFQRRRRVGQMADFLQQAPMQEDDVFLAPFDGRLLVVEQGVQGGAIGDRRRTVTRGGRAKGGKTGAHGRGTGNSGGYALIQHRWLQEKMEATRTTTGGICPRGVRNGRPATGGTALWEEAPGLA